VLYSGLIGNGTEKSLQGNPLTFRVENGNVFVNSAKVVRANLLMANGIIYITDK
jgi:uncharacterized surface protein with fasciclin (FAS1) repeats